MKARTEREWAEEFLFPKVHPVGYADWMREKVDALTTKLESYVEVPPTRKQFDDASLEEVIRSAEEAYRAGTSVEKCYKIINLLTAHCELLNRALYGPRPKK